MMQHHRIVSSILGSQLLRNAACLAWTLDLPASLREYTGPSPSTLPSAPGHPSSSSGDVRQQHAISPHSQSLLAQHRHQHSPLHMQTWVRHLSIRTQSTPNPQSLMFFLGKTLTETGDKTFSSPAAAQSSPLASRIFALDGVASVFFGTDFITVTKRDDEVQWTALKPSIMAAITDHLESGELLHHEAAPSDAAHIEEDDEIVAVIKELLETRIRPAVQEDGGDIMFKSFDPETGVVTVRMMGSCSGCPSSTVTLKSGVENMLIHYVPEVTSVVEEEVDESDGAKALAQLEEKLGDKDA